MQPIDSRIRITLFVAGLLVGAQVLAGGAWDDVRPAESGETLEGAVRRNVAAILKHRRGAVVADPGRDVRWIQPPDGDLGLTDSFGVQTFVALATPPGHAGRDLYRLEARVTPYGVVFDDGWIVNLTNTRLADDSLLTVHERQVATAVHYEGKLTAVEIRDLKGEDPELMAGRSRLARIGNAITNLERTGSRRGLDLEVYAVSGADEPPKATALAFEGNQLRVSGLLEDIEQPVATIRLDDNAAGGRVALERVPKPEKMTYQFLNWLADRGRGFADQGLGPEWAGVGIELMKEVYFKAQEAKADIEEARTDDEPVEVQEPVVVTEAKERARFQKKGAQLPWPPAPLEPMLAERMKGEGLWTPIGSDGVTHQPHAPTPFYKTFVRPEAKYTRKKVWMMVWDPEQVSLQMRAGTSNPVPQTGHRGDGRIKRDPEVLRRVVGGFNGGFQTAHIWYGMMVDKKVLLRPREYGATAGSWADGRTAFGTWPPGAKIPADLVAYRQNLPPLIEDGVFNPYRRRTWGWHRKVAGAVDGKTIRSALCYTNDGYVMYFYAEFTDEHGLANTLFHVGCRYALHLDMNRGHTGFEHYRLLKEGEEPTDDDASIEVAGVRFEGSTLHPTIKHMKAPVRYLGVDYRDYFYLTLRQVVPGADLSPLGGGADGEGVWRTEGLPHNAEFPPRMATTRLSPPGGGRIDVIQVDPRATALGVIEPGGEATTENAKTTAETTAETLMAQIPMGAATGKTNVVIAGLTLSGSQPAEAPAEPLENALVFGTDAAGFAFFAHLSDARVSAGVKALQERGVGAPLWVRGERKSGVRLYQPTRDKTGKPALIEMRLGDADGEVVSRMSIDERGLVLAARPRAPRIVRMFPDMRPKERKKRRP